MKSTSKTFSRNGMSESLGTVVVKELELNEVKIVVFSCVITAEQLNFAEFATETILRSLPISITDNFFTALPSCFEEVNQSLLDKHLETGVSMVVMLEQKGECYLGWVGEVGVLLRTEEQLQLVSEGQTLEEMLDAADLDSDEAHHQLFELQRKKIALGMEAHLGASIKTLLLHPKKGDFILLVTKNLQDQLLDSELEGVSDSLQLSILLQTLLIEASINASDKSYACTSVYIDESEYNVTTTEHLFSEVRSFSENKEEQIANEAATSEVIEIENSSNMKFYVLGIVITFLVSFGVIVLLGGTKKSIENKLITSFRLEDLLDVAMSEQLLHSKNDTLLISFQGKTHEIYVSDGKVITPKEKANFSTKISEKKELEEKKLITQTKTAKEVEKTDNEAEKDKNEVENEDKVDKEEVKQEKDPIKALKKNNYMHVVEKGEGFTFISQKYSKSHPNLTQKKLIEFNLKSDKFVGSKKELEKGNLQIGMELEIPKE